MQDQTLEQFDITQLFTDPNPQPTLAQILAGGVYIDPVTGLPALAPNSNVQTNQNLIGGVISKASYQSAKNGARVLIFPDNDDTIGFASYDQNGTVVFKTIIAGTDVGDVIIGNYAGSQGAKWDQDLGTFSIKGTLSASALDIPDTATANSFHVDNTGNMWLGCTNANFISNNNNAAAFILNTGVARFTSVTLSQSVSLSGLVAGTELAIQGWQFDAMFSPTNNTKVSWTSGTLKFLDGSSYSISSGDTGTMAAITYIYFDKAASQTVLQKTATAANAVGVNKVLICTAQDVASGNNPIFQVFGGNALGGLPALVVAANITAGTITANEIAANTITANKMNVSSLDAISANIGAITAGTITLDTAGYVRGGQTDYNTGTGFFLGYSGAAYKFSIGNPAGNYLTWNGSTLTSNAFVTVVKTGTATYDMSTATGTQNIAHGLAAVPKYAKITIIWSMSSILVFSFGTYDGTNLSCTYSLNDTSTTVTTPNNTTAYVAYLEIGNGGGTYQRATMTFDGTNLILSWTKSGSPTGNAFIMWEAGT